MAHKLPESGLKLYFCYLIEEKWFRFIQNYIDQLYVFLTTFPENCRRLVLHGGRSFCNLQCQEISKLI